MSQKVEAAEPAPEQPVQTRNWFSGWCGGAAVCGDGLTSGSKGDLPVRRCRYTVTNGEKAPVRVLHCSCPCHDDVRVEGDPHFKG